jgi:hypothetical protein
VAEVTASRCSCDFSEPYAAARVVQESREPLAENLRERIGDVRIESYYLKLSVAQEKGSKEQRLVPSPAFTDPTCRI